VWPSPLSLTTLLSTIKASLPSLEPSQLVDLVDSLRTLAPDKIKDPQLMKVRKGRGVISLLNVLVDVCQGPTVNEGA
jgi:hypothetical protein